MLLELLLPPVLALPLLFAEVVLPPLLSGGEDCGDWLAGGSGLPPPPASPPPHAATSMSAPAAAAVSKTTFLRCIADSCDRHGDQQCAKRSVTHGQSAYRPL